jgi:hypothetical protein
MNIKSTFLLGVSKLLEKVIAFSFYFIIARTFGSAEFGEFSYFFSLASFVMVMFDFGGEIYCVRFLYVVCVVFLSNRIIALFWNKTNNTSRILYVQTFGLWI